MIPLKISYIVIVSILVLAGCRSPAVVSETVDADEVEESIFEARQDTVRIQTYTEEEPVISAEINEIIEYYTIQIGAYRQSANAEKIYRLAKQRFDIEASTEYDITDELYKITLGKFTEYEKAREFRNRIMRDYPFDYRDAWVVEFKNHQRKVRQ